MDVKGKQIKMRKLKAEKGTSVIPKGCYCYDENGTCPYWDKIEGAPKQYNGYCWYLEQGDMEILAEDDFTEQNTGEVRKGKDLPFPVSLLWDQCKECGINDDDESLYT